jgi:hypothetical protein
MFRLSDLQWERIRDHFPEENIPEGRNPHPVDPILVDHTHWPEAHMFRITVMRERETVEAIEPAVVCVTARLCRAGD